MKTFGAISLPPNWCDCLPSGTSYAKNIFSKIIKVYLYITTICRFLQKDSFSNVTILFLESFSLTFLFAFTIALFFTRKQNLFVWLLCRNDQQFLGTKKYIYRILIKIIKKSLRPNRLQLLSDSELLAEWFSSLFGQNVNVMPIPHTKFNCSESFSSKNGDIICWVAGQQHGKPFNENVRSD